MTNNDKAKILDKIRKLLALSTSPNENEAASAADKVQALLAEYNLTLADVGGGAQPDEVVRDDDETDSRPWRRQMAQAVGKLYFCGYFYTFRKVRVPTRKIGGYIRYDKHTFVGLQHNVVVARAMFNYLCETIERLSKEGAAQLPAKERTPYITAFQHTAALRLSTRLYERLAAAKKGGAVKTEAGKNLPALLNLYEKTEQQNDAFMEEVGVTISKKTIKIRDERGAADGYKAGSSIGLDPQLKGAASARLIGKS